MEKRNHKNNADKGQPPEKLKEKSCGDRVCKHAPFETAGGEREWTLSRPLMMLAEHEPTPFEYSEVQKYNQS